MTVWRNLANALIVPEIRNRVLFVFGAFAAFVLAVYIQVPYVNIQAWQQILSQGQFLNFLGFLSGGALQRFSVVAMGITPYINASIIMQLLTVVFPEIKEMMQHGGEEGRKKVGLYTRWLTVVLAVVQATTMVVALSRAKVFAPPATMNPLLYLIMVVITLTAGTIWLMWLGEQITDKGIGNGVSLIIFVGIILRYPTYFSQTLSASQKGGLPIFGIVLFLLIAIVSLISIIFMYQGQRRVPVQYAKRVVGRKVYGGRSTYIPLRLNNAGVISIIFAISILLFPQQISAWAQGLHKPFAQAYATFIALHFNYNSFLYNAVYFLLVVGFTFFYSEVVINIMDIGDSLKKQGGFIPGIRPGKPTVDYLQKILHRITVVAAVYLGLLAILPNITQSMTHVTTFYLGSTSLLIVVGVALDTLNQIEARLAMRDYRGFIKQ
ncbi:MAG: preprotein translocase subunit SecY [Candidatus Eremiobacteraeota bacterium]|nr:preprotein translocase subunit SecY [Candidatus Eremiobacteraeota bacterium]MBC5826660.1 preprotein translocase subunit SecY [Candidatus Eremiobacteraeota bacterium]